MKATQKCHIAIYNSFLLHGPKPPEELPWFYMRQFAKPSSDIWYSRVSIGRDTLNKLVQDMCKEPGLGGYRTNHSLGSSAATRLYEVDVDEQLITEVTGQPLFFCCTWI